MHRAHVGVASNVGLCFEYKTLNVERKLAIFCDGLELISCC